MEKLIAAPQDPKFPTSSSIEPQFGEIADAPNGTIDPTLPLRAAAHADHPRVGESDYSLIFRGSEIGPTEVIRFTMKTDADRTAHWILPQQKPDCRIVSVRGDGEARL